MTPAQVIARRRELGLTQVEFAAVLGVTVRTVQRWESGETPVKRLAVLAIEGMRSQPEVVDSQ